MDNTTTYSMNPQQTGNKNKTMMIVITIIVLLLLGAGGYYFYQQSQKPAETKTAVTETSAPTNSPTPTQKPIDKSKVKIQVLNGTGTPGEAKKAVDALVKAGYDEDNITTGNAEEYDQTKANIEAKEDMDAVAKDIQKALEDVFEDVEIDSTELDEDGDYDIVVTTGGKIYEAPTSAPTTKPTAASTTTTTSPSPSPTGSSTTLTPTRSPTP